MTRFTFILLIILCIGLITVRIIQNNSNEELPIYLTFDDIAESHQTNLQVSFNSIHKPDSQLLENFRKDYSAIWGHLNHLYSTNDVRAGKEYYTENWFLHIARNYETKVKPKVLRKDLNHHIVVHSWAWDNLVCNMIDSNIVFEYHYPDGMVVKNKATIAMVLLYEGMHWRVDAMKVLNESKLDSLDEKVYCSH